MAKIIELSTECAFYNFISDRSIPVEELIKESEKIAVVTPFGERIRGWTNIVIQKLNERGDIEAARIISENMSPKLKLYEKSEVIYRKIDANEREPVGERFEFFVNLVEEIDEYQAEVNRLDQSGFVENFSYFREKLNERINDFIQTQEGYYSSNAADVPIGSASSEEDVLNGLKENLEDLNDRIPPFRHARSFGVFNDKKNSSLYINFEREFALAKTETSLNAFSERLSKVIDALNEWRNHANFSLSNQDETKIANFKNSIATIQREADSAKEDYSFNYRNGR